MPYGMYISAAGAQVQSERLQILSNNLANADTPGFKRELAIAQAHSSEAILQGKDTAESASQNNVSGGVSIFKTVPDAQSGPLRKTGIVSDVAIEGDGFFVVERDGEELLTRAGNFRFSGTGRLETASGHPVLTSEGTHVQIDTALPWKITERGEIEQAGAVVPLGLVKPSSLGDLAKAGDNLYRPLADTIPITPFERSVLPEYLEQSTVNPTQEMMQLIETSRAYEANVRLIQHQDQMLGALVNRVLRQS